MIRIEKLTVRYGNRPALSDLSLSVARGAVYALLGRNGAGKSSLVKVLLGQRRADGGGSSVLGLDPWGERAVLMARVGATPETPDAPPDLSTASIARSVAPLYGAWDRRSFDDRIERFGIRLGDRFGNLSRGQKALVMLALALAHDPELLVLDDPTLGLDPVARRYFFEELVVQLADHGTTVFLATHDLDGAERIATHVGILGRGALLADGPIDDVRSGLSLEERFVGLAGEDRSAA